MASESEVAKQIDMLQTVLDKNPDALVFAALDSKAAIPLLEQVDADGIPVIAFDSGGLQLNAIRSGLMKGAILKILLA